MTKPKALRAPSGMGKGGLEFWHRITDAYELRPDELLILEDICRQTLLIEQMGEALKGAPLMTKGSMGQDVVNPLIAELRAHRSARAALMRQLGIPDDPAADGAAPTNQARDAAQSRWAKAHGKGA